MKLPLTSSSNHSLSSSSHAEQGSGFRKRELIAYVVILIQACALFVAVIPSGHMSRSLLESRGNMSLFPALSINNKDPFFHQVNPRDRSNTPRFDSPVIHQTTSSVLVERVWHSKGSPLVNEGLLKGSCWCSGDDYCMCTPALAIDVVLTSGSDHVWLVERKNGQFALMGGYVEVAESVEEAAVRELQEEMNIQLERKDFSLLGVYSDPRRDARRHATSVAFVAEVPGSMIPHPGDDAKKVLRVALDQVDDLNLFIDHKTILQDYKKVVERKRLSDEAIEIASAMTSKLDEPFKRSVCISL